MPTKKTATSKTAPKKKFVLKILSDKPVWHEYQPGIEFELIPLSKTKMRELLLEAKGDTAAYEGLVTDHVIKDWRGLVDENGEVLQVTKANKLFVKDNPILSQWLEQKARGLITQDEAEIKN